MTHTLHALVINLTAQNDGVLPGSLGELAMAAFYAAVDAVDPSLAQQMHDAQNRKAFSLSPLYGYWQSPEDGRIHVAAGQPGWLRLGLLDETLFAVFMQHLLYSGATGGAPSIRLGNIHFTITEALGSPGSHPWVGYTTLEELAEVPKTPGSLSESLDALAKDHEFLLRGDVFTQDVINTWIAYKQKNEVEAVNLRPHPYEFCLYYDI